MTVPCDGEAAIEAVEIADALVQWQSIPAHG